MGGIEQRSDSCLHTAATAVAFSMHIRLNYRL